MRSLTYVNFDLTVSALSEPGRYQVHAISSLCGEATEEFDLPFSDAELEALRLRAERRSRGYRSADRGSNWTAAEFGRRLFETVFAGAIYICFANSLAKLPARKGLRVRLRLSRAPKLVTLPWEFLYESRHGGFIAHSNRTPVVRYIDLPQQPRQNLVAPTPLNILVIVANPNDRRFEALDIMSELRKMQDTFKGSEERGLVRLTLLQSATLSALRRQLNEDTYHIFHFIGHGAFDVHTQEGVLLFEDEQGRSRAVPGQYLTILLRDHPSLRLVLLNACESAHSAIGDPFIGVAQQLVHGGLPAVIAMQFEISDTAAIILADEFYHMIARGRPVEYALAESRKAIYTSEKEVEWGTPVLYMRADSGQLFKRGRSRSISVSEKTRATASFNGPSTDDVPGALPTWAGDTTSWLYTRRAAKIRNAVENVLKELTRLRRFDLLQFIDKVIELDETMEFPWYLSEAQRELHAKMEKLLDARLRSLISLFELSRHVDQQEELFRQHAVMYLSEAAIIDALRWAVADYPYHAELHARVFDLTRLLHPYVDCSSIYRLLWQTHWAPTLLAWPSFTSLHNWPSLFTIPGLYSERPNPFAGKRAEDDHFLLTAMALDFPSLRGLILSSLRRTTIVRRSLYRSLLHDQPTLAVGPRGSGKTGAALLTAHDLLQRKSDPVEVLPIYGALTLHGASLHDLLYSFALSQARTLAVYLANDPRRFLGSSPTRQAAMTRLLTLSFGTGQSLESVLYQSRPNQIDALSPLLNRLRQLADKHGEESIAIHLADSNNLLQTMATAFPETVDRIFALIDIHDCDIQEQDVTNTYKLSVTTLASMVSQLGAIGFIVNCFLPSALADLDQRLSVHFVDRIDLRWSNVELQQLLENRLLIIDDTKEGSLGTLVDADHAAITQLTNAIIQKSDGRPGRLLAIGRRLVNQCAEVGGRISPHAVEEILQEMD